MITLVQRILLSERYELLESSPLPFLELYGRKNRLGSFTSGSILCPVEFEITYSVLEDLQPLVSQIMQYAFGKYEKLEKNTILLYILRNKEEKNLLTVVSEIEEDQYFFKKQVLFYSNNEQDILSAYLGGRDFSQAFHDVLYDQKSFQNYSDGGNEELYSIVSRFFTKLPFLTVQFPEKKVPDLKKNIDDQLRSGGVMELRSTLQEILGDQKKIDKWISEIEGYL